MVFKDVQTREQWCWVWQTESEGNSTSFSCRLFDLISKCVAIEGILQKWFKTDFFVLFLSEKQRECFSVRTVQVIWYILARVGGCGSIAEWDLLRELVLYTLDWKHCSCLTGLCLALLHVLGVNVCSWAMVYSQIWLQQKAISTVTKEPTYREEEREKKGWKNNGWAKCSVEIYGLPFLMFNKATYTQGPLHAHAQFHSSQQSLSSQHNSLRQKKWTVHGPVEHMWDVHTKQKCLD